MLIGDVGEGAWEEVNWATMRKLRRTIARRAFVRVAVTIRAADAAGNRSAVTRRGRISRRRTGS